MGISIPFVGSLWPWKKKPEFKSSLPPKLPPEPMTEEQDELYSKRWKAFQRESKYGPPNYRYSKKVEDDLKEHPLFADKDSATPEELEENRQVWEKLENNNFLKFLAKSEQYAQEGLKEDLEENKVPFWEEDHKMWKALPPIESPFNGPPIPKKAIKTMKEGQDKFVDYFKEHLFGFWGYRNRPYPPQRPCDVQQALGTAFLEERNFDYMMRYSRWYYKDRLGRSRGPMHIANLKTAMASGIVDKDTFVWGDDMDEWAPIGMVYGLEHAINGLDVQFAATGTALIYRLCKGLAPWIPIKGREKKSYKQLQMEGIESKEREKAVMRQNGGVWPGQMIPSHTLFLWASGTELTPLIEGDSMPNKFIPYELRRDLAKVIPGLRPCDVLKLEQVMHRITYNQNWYRVPLGEYNRPPKYYSRLQYNDKAIVKKWWRFWQALEGEYPEIVEEAYRNHMERKKEERLEKCYKKLAKYAAKRKQLREKSESK